MLICERLQKLIRKMKEKGMDYFLITSQDYHNSEYVHEHFKAREYFSGFDGSNGSLLISEKETGLWTDGRYFLQAEEQLSGTGITLYKMGNDGVLTILEYLEKNMKEGETLGTDGRCISFSFGDSLEKLCQKKHGRLLSDTELISEVWIDRPALPQKEIWYLPKEYSGEGTDEKIKRLRKYLEEKNADYLWISKLDDIMWLYNIRGNDVKCNPVALSYTLIGKKEAFLYIATDVLTEKAKKYLDGNQIQCIPYQDTLAHLRTLELKNQTVLLEQESVSYLFYKEIEQNGNVVCDSLPTTMWKAVKNETEQQNLREIYLKDSAVVCKFLYWLKKTVQSGETVTEMSAAAKLDQMRESIPGFLDLSFDTITGYAENGAIVHYEASEKTNRIIEPKGMILVDSGGQYLQGTTDVTRTIALGDVTEEEKRLFSAVVAGMLRLADAVFLYGCTGRNLDILAREDLWKLQLDYKHGTGHGVGFCLNVHEGPQRFYWKYTKDVAEAVLEPGMLISDEPGVYLENQFGIRTENIIMVQPLDENEYGKFLHFEMLTFVPIDRAVLDKKFLSEEDICRINAYHKEVFEKISPLLSEEEAAWLKKETRPL